MKALLAVTEECGPDVSVGFGTIVVLQPHLDAPEAAVFVAPLERVGENLLVLGTTCSTSDASLSTSVNSSSSASYIILWLILRMDSQKQHGFTASQLKFNNQVVADMVRLPGVLLSPVPLTRDEVELGATFQSQSICFCSPRYDELVEQMIHRVALSKLVSSLFPPGL